MSKASAAAESLYLQHGPTARRNPRQELHKSERTRAPTRDILGLQRSSCACGGGCPRCQDKYPLQAKLEASHPGDALEREADRVAEQVLREPRAEAQAAPESRDSSAVRLSSAQLPPLVNEVLSTPGEPLDPATRDFMEPRFGRELGQVRIHRDERAAESTRSVNARAYTVGTHVVFGEGEYAPSGDAGKRLLAHEMAHVLQQDRSGSLAVQRREGTYPNTEYQSHGFPYTVLKPKKLNVKGPFSAALVDLISSWYADVPKTCSPIGAGQKGSICVPAIFKAQQAVLIMNLLESSKEFLGIAAKLDEFYAEEKNPGFRIFGGGAGTKFVPAGAPYKVDPAGNAMTEGNDVILLDTGVNPRMEKGDPLRQASEDEQIAVAFVDALVHEAVHAFRRASKLTKGGLEGAMEEELATRKKSSAILKGIQSGSSQKGIQDEAEKYIRDIGADTLTLKQVALSMVSGDKITYLESYYVDGAIREFFEKYSSSKPDAIPELADLDHPSAVTSGGVEGHVGEVRSLIERHSEPREMLVDRDVSMTGVEPPLKVETLPPQSPVLNAHDVFRLSLLLVQTETLKDLVKEAANVKKFSPAGLAVFYHVLLMKASLIKESLKQEHADAALDAKSKDHEKFSNALAGKYLGETKPYDKLK